MAKLSLDSNEYESGLNKAENKTSGLKSTISKLGIGAALGSMGKAALDVGMDFEKSMSQVAGTMGISADAIKAGDKSFESLSAAARKAGRTTQFSAAQGAEGLNYMALAGLNAEESIELLPKVLNLATAGSMGLAEASDMVTDGMSALGIELEYADGFLDQMAVTSQKSNTSISQLGQAMLTVGGTAKVLKGGTLEMNTALGILADAGTKGAEGGTALRNVILSLASPTDKASKELKKMGISVFDSKGEMRGLQDILMDLDKSLSSMTDEKKTQVLSKIFNKVDLKSINTLLDNSNERWTELQTNIEESAGATEAMAETVNANLSGALTSMGSALGDVGIAVYEKFKTPLTEAVQGLTKMVVNLVEAFESGKLDKILSLIGAALAGVVTQMVIMKTINIVSVISTFAITVIKAASMVKSFSGAMAILNTVMMANPIGLIIAAIAGLVAGFIYLWNTSEGFKNFWISAWNTIREFTSTAITAITNFFTVTIPNAIDNMITWFQQLPTRISEWLTNTINTVSTWATNMFNKAVETGQNFINGITEFFSNLPEKVGFFIGESLTKTALWAIDMWNKSKETGKNFINGVSEFFATLPGKIKTWFDDVIAKTTDWATNMWNKAKQAGSDFLSAIGTFFNQLPGKIWNWLVQTYNKVTTFAGNLARKGFDAGKNFATNIINAIKNLPSQFYSIGSDIVRGVWNGIVGMGSWITSKVKGFFKGIADGAKSALGIHSPSRVFRDEVGQWIPKGVEVGIEREMPNLQRTVEQEFSNLANVDIESPQYNIQARQNDFFDKIQNLKVEVPLVMDGIEVARAIVEPFKEIEREYDQTHNIKFAYN